MHAGDASTRKDGKLSAELKIKLSAALPIDMGVYNMMRDDLLKKDANFKATDVANGIADRQDLVETDIPTTKFVKPRWHLKVHKGKVEKHMAAIFRKWFSDDERLVTEKVETMMDLLNDLDGEKEGLPGYLNFDDVVAPPGNVGSKSFGLKSFGLPSFAMGVADKSNEEAETDGAEAEVATGGQGRALWS